MVGIPQDAHVGMIGSIHHSFNVGCGVEVTVCLQEDFDGTWLVRLPRRIPEAG